MPRKPRQLSCTNTYHVVIRGLDRQIMFENDRDYRKYLDILFYYKQECGFLLYAYCLMTNHIHLILKIETVPLETIFRKINTHYSVWFNMKYQRTGPLQQGRYYSEPIQDETYLLTAIRYVHRNPVNAGMESEVGTDYPWSSIWEYINQESTLTDVDKTYELFSAEYFVEYCRYHTDETCLDIDTIKKRIPDDVAKEIIFDVTNCQTSTEFQNLSLADRDTAIRKCRKQGISIRQLNRLTGIPKGVIERIK